MVVWGGVRDYTAWVKNSGGRYEGGTLSDTGRTFTPFGGLAFGVNVSTARAGY